MKTETELRKTLRLLEWFEEMPCPEMTPVEHWALTGVVGMLRWVLGQEHQGTSLTDELIRGVEKMYRDVLSVTN